MQRYIRLDILVDNQYRMFKKYLPFCTEAVFCQLLGSDQNDLVFAYKKAIYIKSQIKKKNHKLNYLK